jgi:hypothetical protein
MVQSLIILDHFLDNFSAMKRTLMTEEEESLMAPIFPQSAIPQLFLDRILEAAEFLVGMQVSVALVINIFGNI